MRRGRRVRATAVKRTLFQRGKSSTSCPIRFDGFEKVLPLEASEMFFFLLFFFASPRPQAGRAVAACVDVV
jgi:hypothetical protein